MVWVLIFPILPRSCISGNLSVSEPLLGQEPRCTQHSLLSIFLLLFCFHIHPFSSSFWHYNSSEQQPLMTPARFPQQNTFCGVESWGMKQLEQPHHLPPHSFCLHPSHCQSPTSSGCRKSSIWTLVQVSHIKIYCQASGPAIGMCF